MTNFHEHKEESKRKANFFDSAKSKAVCKSRRPITSEQAETAIVAGGSFARPNPRADGKARDAAKQLRSVAKKAQAFGARNASAAAYNAADTITKATGSSADAMRLASLGRDKVKDVKLRAKTALKSHPDRVAYRGGGDNSRPRFPTYDYAIETDDENSSEEEE